MTDIQDIIDKYNNIVRGDQLMDSKDENGNTLLHHCALYLNSVDPESVDFITKIKENSPIDYMLSIMEGRTSSGKQHQPANLWITNNQNLTAFDLLIPGWKMKMQFEFLSYGFITNDTAFEKTKDYIKQLPIKGKIDLLITSTLHFSEYIHYRVNAGIANLKWLITYLFDLNVKPGLTNGRKLFHRLATTSPYTRDVSEIANKWLVKSSPGPHSFEEYGMQLAIENPERELARRENLKMALEHYIKRIEMDQKNVSSDFTHGFRIFKHSQAANRKANYNLAKTLINQLDEFTMSIEEISAKANINMLRGTFKHNRGINSADLNYIIKAMRNDKPVAMDKLQKSEEDKYQAKKKKS